MDRFSYQSLDALRRIRPREPESDHLTPFGARGAGQWTAHPVGALVAFGVVIMVLTGIPESRSFLLVALTLGGLLGWIMLQRHR